MAWSASVISQSIANLKQAIATGAYRARILDRDTTFRGLDHMYETLAWLENELAEAQNRSRVKRITFLTSKGL